MSKKTRLRECPAASRSIEAFECAAARHTTYACPESCAFNVFASVSYPKLLDIEQAAEEKYLKWVATHAADRTQSDSDLRRTLGESPDRAFFQCLAWHGTYRIGPSGDTCIGEWAKAGFPGLGTDERLLMRGRMRLQPAMIEVHRILDNTRVEVVDLLDPERGPFVIADTDFALHIARFEVYAAHTFPLPHYSRLLGTCLLVPNFHPLPPEEVVHELIRHLGGPNDNPGRRAWLAEHFDKFDDALEAVALARRQAMFKALDGQFGKAVDPKFDPALVPPTLLRDTPKLLVTSSLVKAPTGTVMDDAAAAGIIYDRQQGILDEPIPALDNKTPRAAAADPALRLQLLRWMKFWISQTDRTNLQTGRNDDTNWMVRELGLTEILFDPPPPRPRQPSADEENAEDEEGPPPYLALPVPPALPDRPWTKPEAFQVLQRALQTCTDTWHPAEYFSDLQYPLFPDLDELLGEEFNEHEISFLFQAASWLVLCFAPRDTRPPDFSPEDLAANLRRHLAKLGGVSEASFDETATKWLDQSRQPNLLAAVLTLALSWMQTAPPNLQVREISKAFMMATLGAVVDTLDQAARSVHRAVTVPDTLL